MVLRKTHLQGSPIRQAQPYPRSPTVDEDLLQTLRKYQAWEMDTPHLAAQEIHLKGGTIMVLSSYHRGGVDWDLLAKVAELTKGRADTVHPVWRFQCHSGRYEGE